MQTSQLAALFTPLSITAMPPSALRVIQAARIAIIAQRRGIGPLMALTERLGDEERARHMLHLIHVTGAIWPEPFMLSPPCCGRLTHDEALLGELAAHAETADRPAFDRASADLIGDDERDQLWRALSWAA